MRKKALEELEIRIRESIERFYVKAYTVTGEKNRAEKLTENAVFCGAKRYTDLMNKARFYDIVEQKIGNGGCTDFEPTDYEALCDRITIHIRTWNVKSTVGKWVGTVSVLLAVLVGSLSQLLPELNGAHSNAVLVMEGALAIGGDYDSSELVNYQRVSDFLDIPPETMKKITMSVYEQYLAFAVTAPDGTPYIVVNNFGEMNSTSGILTLYRGYQDGWKAVGTADIGAGYTTLGVGTYWCPSELYAFADNDSNIYVIFQQNSDVVLYRYDIDTEIFEKTATIPHKPIDDFSTTISFDFDSAFGETGTAYLACQNGEKATILRYDTASDTISVIKEDIKLTSPYSNFSICTKNDIVYGLDVIRNSTVSAMTLNVIYPDGYVDFEVFEKDDVGYAIYMKLDKDGILHLITQGKKGYYHYVFSEDLTFAKAELKMAYSPYEDTDYGRIIVGGFLGEDGNVYCLERYYDSAGGEQNFIAIGMTDAKDPAKYTYINGFDLIDNFGWNPIINGKDICYMTTEYNMDEPFVIYFHINELA